MNRLRKNLNFPRTNIQTVDTFSYWSEELSKRLPSLQKDKADIIIIGEWDIGDKSRWFIEKTDQIHSRGFKTTPKIMLWADIVWQCKQNEAYAREIADAINNCFDGEYLLAVRSSGQWDASGIWIYESRFCYKDSTSIQSAIAKVITSNQAPMGVAYRKKLQLEGDDMGICIEPCIGNKYTHNRWYNFGPELSGRARSDKSNILEMGVAAGIGWGVSNRDYYAIDNSKDIIMKTLWETIQKEIIAHDREYDHKNKSSTLYKRYKERNSAPLTLLSDWGEKSNYGVDLREVQDRIYPYPLAKLFSSIKLLEADIGIPQYVERASQYQEDTQSFDTYITQIADIAHHTATIDTNQTGKLVATMDDIENSGIKDIEKVIILSHRDLFGDVGKRKSTINTLREYNNKNDNYLLIVDSEFTYGNWFSLGFDCFSNAAGIIEIRGIKHLSNPAWHYLGLLQSADMLFGTTDRHTVRDIKNLWWKYVGHYRNILEIDDKKFRYIQDKAKKFSKLLLQD